MLIYVWKQRYVNKDKFRNWAMRIFRYILRKKYFAHLHLSSMYNKFMLNKKQYKIMPQANIIHGYSQISLVVETQIISCACKIHAMSLNSFDSSCLSIMNVYVSDPLTTTQVYEGQSWLHAHEKVWNLGLTPLFKPSSCMFMHVLGYEHAWTGHEVTMIMDITSMRYEHKFPNSLVLYIEHEHTPEPWYFCPITFADNNVARFWSMLKR